MNGTLIVKIVWKGNHTLMKSIWKIGTPSEFNEAKDALYELMSYHSPTHDEDDEYARLNDRCCDTQEKLAWWQRQWLYTRNTLEDDEWRDENCPICIEEMNMTRWERFKYGMNEIFGR